MIKFDARAPVLTTSVIRFMGHYESRSKYKENNPYIESQNGNAKPCSYQLHLNDIVFLSQN